MNEMRAKTTADLIRERDALRRVASAAAHFLAVRTLEQTRGVLVLDSSEQAIRDLERALAEANLSGSEGDNG
jgi:aspartokinase-like uncharacterized kinase